MDGFSGIRPEAIWLLAENRFHDSREFYEEHKAQLKTQIVEPLRRLVEDLAPAGPENRSADYRQSHAKRLCQPDPAG